MTGLSEAVWAPRSLAWQMYIAPDGDEAIFVSMTGLTSLITSPLVSTLNGALNGWFVPNCAECRSHAHFCAIERQVCKYDCRLLLIH